MEYTYELIPSNLIGRYADLALKEQLQRAKFRNVSSVAAFDTSSEHKRALGLIQYAQKNDGLELLWVYVSDDHRRQGIGRGLIKYLLDTAKGNHSQKVYARIPEDLDIDLGAEEMSEFLLNNGFKNKEVVPGQWSVTGKDVFLENFKLGKKQLDELFRNIVPFEKCTSAVVSGCARAMKLRDPDDVLHAEKSLSFICESGGSYKGMIWTNKYGDALYPEGLVFLDENVRDRLIAAFLVSYSRNIRYADRVIVRESEISGKWMRKFFPETSTNKTILLTT